MSGGLLISIRFMGYWCGQCLLWVEKWEIFSQVPEAGELMVETSAEATDYLFLL